MGPMARPHARVRRSETEALERGALKVGMSEVVQTSPELERARRIGILARGAKRRVEKVCYIRDSGSRIQMQARRFFEEKRSEFFSGERGVIQ